MSEFNNSPLHHFGGDGAHGTDLKKRGIIPSDSITIGEGSEVPEKIDNAVITIPIGVTSKVISGILDCWHPTALIANFSGVMTITTPKIHANRTSSFHVLGGPQSPINELKVVHANDGVNDKLSRMIIANIQAKGIEILELSRIEHDTAMAFHQALTHIVVILHDSTPGVMKISPGTSPQIIAEMILINPFFREAWKMFRGFISKGNSLGEAYSVCMQEINPNSSTPNSRSQVGNAMDWNFAPSETLIQNLDRVIQEQDLKYMMQIINDSRKN